MVVYLILIVNGYKDNDGVDMAAMYLVCLVVVLADPWEIVNTNQCRGLRAIHHGQCIIKNLHLERWKKGQKTLTSLNRRSKY